MFQYMYSPDKLPFFSSVEVSKSSYVPASQPSPQKMAGSVTARP